MSVVIPGVVTCEGCGEDYEHYFTFPPRVETVQDITDDDVEPQPSTCPDCQWTQTVEYGGWVSHDDAG